MQLFYEPDFENKQEFVEINSTESRHIAKVLRKNNGDLINITNGRGLCAKGILVSNHPKKCVIKVDELLSQNTPEHLHIAIAPTKANDRFEWFLEKSTEIGITEITPIICQNSERRKIKPERYEKVLQAAMKQSLKFHLPVLNPLQSYEDFIKMNTEEKKLIAHCEDSEKSELSSKIEKNILVLIGPEGDFSSTEIEKALSHGFEAINLSDSRLRTETAGIVACHTINLMRSL
ncbi:16S rRNA (uracil(1498)-N(3))-methyltransferase [Psychroflexus aestuariivivens]|uniref:16S rRNA (uracil(1498)-N(3))-methyltransferase n=1 Tax=Psychroflexus aestuariivivens TaxID=1795040 RepID=UPI000FD70143|nr:16S rRNA (uracil(1498)-N(3))-methyltransferase [Psychroflexus aestuariivivens]